MPPNGKFPDAEGYAKALIEKECFDAFQSLEYEVNTLHTSNGQTPFVTFGFWPRHKLARTFNSTVDFENRIRGLVKITKHRSSLNWSLRLKKGVNQNEQDPNYDIKKTGIRMCIKTHVSGYFKL